MLATHLCCFHHSCTRSLWILQQKTGLWCVHTFQLLQTGEDHEQCWCFVSNGTPGHPPLLPQHRQQPALQMMLPPHPGLHLRQPAPVKHWW